MHPVNSAVAITTCLVIYDYYFCDNNRYLSKIEKVQQYVADYGIVCMSLWVSFSLSSKARSLIQKPIKQITTSQLPFFLGALTRCVFAYPTFMTINHVAGKLIFKDPNSRSLGNTFECLQDDLSDISSGIRYVFGKIASLFKF